MIGDYSESIENRKAAVKSAREARKRELKKMKEGWRYVKVTDTLRVFVPCDKLGNPTEEGLKRIERQKKMLLTLK